jgi:hypothetical protein
MMSGRSLVELYSILATEFGTGTYFRSGSSARSADEIENRCLSLQFRVPRAFYLNPDRGSAAVAELSTSDLRTGLTVPGTYLKVTAFASLEISTSTLPHQRQPDGASLIC